MALSDEIKLAKTEVVADGYEMSIGEVINLYRDNELIVNPAFQRLFRWDSERKSRFIESLLLGIPVPPIFVYQDRGGKWELIDGLQRLSTVLEFVGVLMRDDGTFYEPSTLDGTGFLPSLAGKRWSEQVDGDPNALDQAQQLQIKRARLRVEILKNESDPKAKFELFQRLNTGGATLSPQEVRNCVAVMIDPQFFEWSKELAANTSFGSTVDQTETAIERQALQELVLRFLAFRNVPYHAGLNVHEYLDKALIQLASDNGFDRVAEADIFRRTFNLLEGTLGAKAFKRWNGHDFTGKFLMSVYEVVAKGVSENIDAIDVLGEEKADFIKTKCRDLWTNATFTANNGAGVRGTTRLTNLLPMASDYFTVQ